MQQPQAKQEVEPALLEIAGALAAELHGAPGGEPGTAARLRLSDSLDGDLGLDSLARVELLFRVQRAFGVDLPEATLERAETLQDIADALAAAPAARAPARPAAAPGEPSAKAPAPAPAATGLPVDARTLVEVLEWHLERQPERTQITLLGDEGEFAISYRALAQAAGRVAAGLQLRGLAPRQTVAIMLPTSPDYFYVYFGILLAGGVPVPIYPPARLAQIEEHVRRHARILANARAAMMVTVRQGRAVAHLLQGQVESLRAVVSADELLEERGAPQRVPVGASDTAFIQYTSGSTGDPKGVVLTHANLLANLRAMGPGLGVRPDDVFVSWLPLYHDMGLIGAWLGTLYYGLPLVVMSPLAFLARPVRWLRAIQHYRGTLSAAPNFAYELCARKIDDSELQGLDLSSWRLAANGAEAVLPDTLARFRDRFAPYGLRPEAITPVYGLAECSVGLAFPPPGRGPRIDSIRRDAFVAEGQALPAVRDDPAALRFVSCGHAIPGHALRVVDAQGRALAERLEGRLEFRGPSATAGYLDNPKANAQLLRDGWLDTGDRAYIADGELFITGRVKDIVIRGGRNIYPHEVEEVVSEVAGVRKGCVAVFGSADPGTGTERLVVLAESREQAPESRERVRAAIADRVLAVLGEPADVIAIAPPHTVLKTSSGKIRRSACRELFESGRVGAHQRGARWQIARLALSAAPTLARRALNIAGSALYAAWTFLWFALLAPTTWLLTALAWRPEIAWAISHRAARALLRLSATPFSVEGLEHLPRDGACVLVANHSSYADGVVLVAALPRRAGFVAKRELLAQPIARIYLARMDAEFVERFAAHQSVEDAARLQAQVKTGRALMFFPEGTFTVVAGLRPFRLGAFVAAANAGVPVVPIAINGTRRLLPGERWWPTRSAVRVVIGAPIAAPPDASDPFTAAIALRDAARAHILAYCGESDLSRRGA